MKSEPQWRCYRCGSNDIEQLGFLPVVISGTVLIDGTNVTTCKSCKYSEYNTKDGFTYG